MKIKRIEPMSLAKVMGLLYVIFGFIAGVFMLFALVLAPQQGGPRNAWFGMAAPLALPLVYGIMGFVMGFITAWLYNIVAKKIGGVELETE